MVAFVSIFGELPVNPHPPLVLFILQRVGFDSVFFTDIPNTKNDACSVRNGRGFFDISPSWRLVKLG